jgi:hypothetical protein
MPNLLLRHNVTVAAYPDEYRIIRVMSDGYELDVGGISKRDGAHQRTVWAWSAPNSSGEADTRDEAMEKLRAAFASVTPETLARDRQQQEWTANKYALWEFGYRSLLGRGPIKCKCGEMFDPGLPEQTMAHIEHITGRKAGT